MAVYDFDSNVLAAIAKGVDFNPFGNLAEGYLAGNKQRLAQQAQDENARNNKALEELKRQDLMKPDPVPAEVQLFNLYRQNPDAVAGFLNAKRPYVPLGSGGALDTDTGQVINPAPKTTRVTAGILTGKDKAQEEVTSLENTRRILQEAYDLAPKAYSGYGAAPRAAFVQGVGGWLPDGTIDPRIAEGARATKEFSARMTPEALKGMAKYLKPITEKEGKMSIETLADPNADPETKQAIINMLSRNVDAELASKRKILEQWTAEANPQAPTTTIAPPPAGAPGGGSPYRRPAEIDDATWGAMTPEEQRMYLEAPE